MPRAKTNSASKPVKRSRKKSSLILTIENDYAPDEMIFEEPQVLQSSFDQPSSHVIDLLVPSSTTDQLPLVLSKSTDLSLSSAPSVNRSTSQSENGTSSLVNRSTTSLSNNRLSAPPPVNSSTTQSTNSSSSLVNRSTTSSLSSNNRLSSSPSTVNRSVSHSANGSLSSNNRLSSPSPVNHTSSQSKNSSLSLVNRSTTSSSSNNRLSSSPSTVNRSVSHSANGSSSSSNNRLSSPSPVNHTSSQSKNSSSSLVNRSTTSSSSNNRLSSLPPPVNRSTSHSANGSPVSVNRFKTSSNNRPSSSPANKSSVSHLATNQFSSQSATNGSSSPTNIPSYSDSVEHTANNNNDDNDSLEDDSTQKESLVWQYATKDRLNQTATCLICNAVIKATNWSTTGVRKHLTQVHKITSIGPAVIINKPTFSPSLRKELHELIIKSIIEDSRSFNDYRRPGMLKVLRKAIPGYVPPHRITVAKRLKRLHGFYKRRLQQQMLEINKISITCDFWSDRSLKSFLCVTGHYLTYDFGYESTVLSFDAFYDRHYGVRIAKIIKEKLNNLKLYNKLLCITTDGASNMKTMCSSLYDVEFDWIWCVAHRYHLVINNALGFWPENKKKKKKKKENINNNNDDNNKNYNNNNDDNNKNYNNNNDDNNKNYNNNNNNSIQNNTGGVHDDTTEIGELNSDEDEQSFWDDATKDHSDGQQHISDFTDVKENESMDINDFDYDEILIIEETIYGVITESSNTEQKKFDVVDQSLNNDETYVIDDETFIDYMTNNNLLRDDWDLDLDLSNNVAINTMNKRMILTVISKCRSLITILNQSTVLSGYFDQLRLEFPKIKRRLPADCITRWNSTYFLIDSFINAKNLIIKFFGNKNLYDVRRTLIKQLILIELHHDDWQVLTDLHEVLKPFYLAIKLMSIRSYPTAGLCYYTVKFIFNYLTKYDPRDTAQIISFKLMLLSQIEYYFFSEKGQLNLLKKYAFFDPLGYSALDENDIWNAEQEIKQIIRNGKIYQDELPTTSSSNSFSSTSSSSASSTTAKTTTSSTSKKPSIIEQFLIACGEAPFIDNQNSKNGTLSIDEELIIYKEYITGFYRQHRTESCALRFWKEHHTKLPILAQLARAYLSTPGTSISSEAAFSISAYVGRKERARLSPENLSYTMFMKDKVAAED